MRKKVLFKIVQFFAAVAIFSSCSKDKIEKYGSGPYINLLRLDADTISVSFDLMPKDDSLFSFPLNVMGYAESFDRVVKVETDRGSTAEAGVHFEVLPCTVKAGSVLDTLRCMVHKTSDVTETNFKYISLELVSNEWFQPGIANRVVIQLTAGLPNGWSTNGLEALYAEYAYGAYSKTKFRFIMNALGTSAIVKLASDYNTWTALKLFLNAKLEEYERDNGPLMDENNNRVTFPL